MVESELLFLDLFEAVRSAMKPLGLPLGLEQYDWLCQAIKKGYALESWEQLRRVCQRLWVKPIPSYDVALKVFNQTFDRYVEQYYYVFSQSDEAPARSDSVELQYPEIPPRQGYRKEVDRKAETKTIAAVNTGAPQSSPRPVGQGEYQLILKDLPISLTQVQQNWRSLKQSVREGTVYEVDIDATVEEIVRQGVMNDIRMRPVMQQRAELVVLIDDHSGMIPFRYAIAPLIQAVEGGWVSPAEIYRFTSYVDHYLYGWRRAGQATAIETILARLHPSRTVLVIVSDAGAAFGAVSGAQIVGMKQFVDRAMLCVRQLIWLNPLPSERWKGCSAQAIEDFLGGRMIAIEEFNATKLRSRELGGVLV